MKAVNLLPESRRATTRSAVKSQERAARMVVITTGAAVFLIAALSAVAVVNGRSAAKDKQATLDALQQQVADAQASTRAEEQKKSEVKIRFDAVALAASPARRMRWDVLLDAVSRALPKGAWLSTMQADSPTPVVVDPTKAPASAPGAAATLPTQFVVGGFVTSNTVLPQVLRRLSLLPMLSNLWLQQTSRVDIGSKTAISFTIVADLEGGH
jgi:Fimbrial assembly protein (PilN)